MIRVFSRVLAILAISAVVPAMHGVASAPAWGQKLAAASASVARPDASPKPAGETSLEIPPLIAIADFNRDGIPDTAEAVLSDEDSAHGLLTLTLANPDGTLSQAFSKPVLGREPRSMVATDVNRDGNPDLIVGDDDGSLMLFLGDGTGNLFPAGSIAHLDSVVSIAVGDFNHDGVPDMAVSDWRSGSVIFLLGAGDGSFIRQWSLPLRMPGTAPALVVADFNKDGIPDLAVVYGDDGAYTYDVLLGDGKGYFSPSPQLSFVRDPNSHCNT
jgi:hypothetical protein